MMLYDGQEGRLSPDDMASRREAEFTEASIEEVLRHSGERQATPGICHNCGEHLPDGRVYCDAECRADDEARDSVSRRKAVR